MSRKHFRALAEMVKNMPELLTPTGVDISDVVRAYVAEELAKICEAMNPRFDRRRFFQACGLEYPVSLDS